MSRWPCVRELGSRPPYQSLEPWSWSRTPLAPLSTESSRPRPIGFVDEHRAAVLRTRVERVRKSTRGTTVHPMRSAVYQRALCLSLAASIAAACNPLPRLNGGWPTSASPAVPSVISPNLAATCASPASRAIQPFLQLSREMSFPEICRQVGIPTKEIGSGVYIFVYLLDDDSTVTMSFSSLEADSQVISIWLTQPDGTELNLLE